MSSVTLPEIKIVPLIKEVPKPPKTVIVNPLKMLRQEEQKMTELASGISGGFNGLAKETPTVDLSGEKGLLIQLSKELELLGQAAEKQLETPGEIPTISEAKKQENLKRIREGFLHQDKEGRSVAGGTCSEAFQELIDQCGDPHLWTAEDMQRPEIQDVTITYHTLALLRDRRSALTPDEQQVLKRLILRQEKINGLGAEAISKRTNLANLPESTRQVDNLVNQRELNELSQALGEGVPTEEYHTAPLTNGKVRSKWATPVDMGSRLTQSIWDLYHHSLKMTNRDRANIQFPQELLTGSPTPEEIAARLALLEKIKQKALQSEEKRQEDRRDK